jgi:hypothetical protein
MKNTQLILLELAVLFISSLFLMTNSVHLQAFAQTQEQLQLGIPGLIPPEQQQLSSPQQEPGASLTAQGTINSLIYAPQTKWIATGNWSMDVNNGNVTSFITNMLWYNDNGTATHTHEIQNFKSTEGKMLTVQPDNSLFLKGLVDVGTNQRMVWKNVHSTIDIKGGKTIVISLDHKQTNNHFAKQSIYGVVTSLTPCSDEPGPNMEVLPSCRLPSDTGFSNSSTQPYSTLR